MNNKNTILALVVIVIAAGIWYLESAKPKQDSSAVQSIAVVAPTSDSQTKTGANTSAQKPADRKATLVAKSARYPAAVEIIPGAEASSSGFINSGPFTLKSLIGKKVILVDFWTYSCINCQRTIPYLNAWYDKYKDSGLVIVGVHSPEFGFEKEYANVVKGVKDLGIQYPVVQDNNISTWNAYGNRYWPHEYLIDIDGYVVDDKIGEGGYGDTEAAIQRALKERADVLGTKSPIPSGIVAPKDAIIMDGTKLGSPETYFGSARNEYLADGNRGAVGMQSMKLPSPVQENLLYLDGTWDFKPEFAENTGESAKIVYRYTAKNVYFVASSDKGVTLSILIDGKPIDGMIGGKDVKDGKVFIKDNRLYSIVASQDYETHTLEIRVEGSGLDAFTFTFG